MVVEMAESDTAETKADSLTPGGHVGLKFGEDVRIGGSRKVIPTGMERERSVFLPGHRTAGLGLPNRGVFHRRLDGEMRDVWAAFGECGDAGREAVRLDFGGEGLAFGGVDEGSALEKAKMSAVYYLLGCGAEGDVVVVDEGGEVVPVLGKAEMGDDCRRLVREVWPGKAVHCLEVGLGEMRVYCGHKLVVRDVEGMDEIDLRECRVKLVKRDGKVAVYSSCGGGEADCE